MSMTTKQINKKFISSMKKVAKALEKAAADITQAQFFANDPADISEWDIRKAGGFGNLKKMYFPKEENLEVKHGARLLNSHRNKLEKQYGEALYVQKEILREFKDIISKNPPKFHKPLKKAAKKTKKSRTIVAKISDTHFGANISRHELNNLNEYNWTIAARRMALFMEQICNYKPHYRDETDLVIQLNGDIIAGQIHNQEWFVDVLTDQFAGTLHLLGQAISYCANHFDKITVVCTPGNHGRNVGKADRGRATTHKWDSYENMIYIALEQMMIREWENVKFTIPQAPFALYKVQGHNIFQTHGDTVLNVGNPGKAISMASIDAQINKINASELTEGLSKIAVACVGHVHVPTAQVLESGCIAMINGCLSGVDPFAQSIGIFSNNPTQLMFEATKKHPVGDMRMIQVKGADKDTKYDKIIEPYERLMDKP